MVTSGPQHAPFRQFAGDGVMQIGKVMALEIIGQIVFVERLLLIACLTCTNRDGTDFRQAGEERLGEHMISCRCWVSTTVNAERLGTWRSLDLLAHDLTAS